MEQNTKSFTRSIIGVDFSLNKPAACVFLDNKYEFFGWPYGVKDKILDVYRECGVHIITRIDNKDDNGINLHQHMRYEVQNAQYLSNLIRESLQPYLNRNTLIAFEGLSYASSGAHVLQLGGYKYMLMSTLSEHVPLENMFTYTPITIKSIAGCAKKGMGKSEMIDAFIEHGPKCKLRLKLFEFPEKFQSPKAKNWIVHLDDIVDSFWVIETLRRKENI